MKITRTAAGMVVILFSLGIFLSGCTKDKSNHELTEKTPIAELMAAMNIKHITQPTGAPDFELFSVKGQKVSLSQYRGKVVLLSFWSTW